MAMLLGCRKRLHGHDSSVNQAGANGEPNEAEVPQGVSSGQQQEHAQRGVHAKDHLLVFGLLGLPTPPRGPRGHHERVDANDENQTYEDKDNAEITQPGSRVQVILLQLVWN